VKRTIIDGNVLGVEYELTALGLSLNDPFTALCNWINAHGEKMEVAQQSYDKRKAS
jgi:DNA-binding HxlR family transcriptional regulator